MSISTFFSFVERGFDYAEKCTVYAGVALFVIITVLAAFQIFMRYIGAGLLGISTVWTEELARYLLVIMVFVGAPYAMRNDDNISIRPLFRLASATTQKVLITFSNAMIVVFSLLVIFSVAAVIDRTIGVSLSTMRWLTVGYAHIVLAAMFILVALFAVEETVNMWLSDEPPITEKSRDIEVDVDTDPVLSDTDGGN